MEIISQNTIQNFENLNEILGFEYLNRVQLQILDKILLSNLAKIKSDMDDLSYELDRVGEYTNPKQQTIEIMLSYQRLENTSISIENVRLLIGQRLA